MLEYIRKWGVWGVARAGFGALLFGSACHSPPYGVKIRASLRVNEKNHLPYPGANINYLGKKIGESNEKGEWHGTLTANCKLENTLVIYPSDGDLSNLPIILPFDCAWYQNLIPVFSSKWEPVVYLRPLPKQDPLAPLDEAPIQSSTEDSHSPEFPSEGSHVFHEEPIELESGSLLSPSKETPRQAMVLGESTPISNAAPTEVVQEIVPKSAPILKQEPGGDAKIMDEASEDFIPTPLGAFKGSQRVLVRQLETKKPLPLAGVRFGLKSAGSFSESLLPDPKGYLTYPFPAQTIPDIAFVNETGVGAHLLPVQKTSMGNWLIEVPSQKRKVGHFIFPHYHTKRGVENVKIKIQSKTLDLSNSFGAVQWQENSPMSSSSMAPTEYSSENFFPKTGVIDPNSPGGETFLYPESPITPFVGVVESSSDTTHDPEDQIDLKSMPSSLVSWRSAFYGKMSQAASIRFLVPFETSQRAKKFGLNAKRLANIAWNDSLLSSEIHFVIHVNYNKVDSSLKIKLVNSIGKVLWRAKWDTSERNAAFSVATKASERVLASIPWEGVVEGDVDAPHASLTLPKSVFPKKGDVFTLVTHRYPQETIPVGEAQVDTVDSAVRVNRIYYSDKDRPNPVWAIKKMESPKVSQAKKMNPQAQ
jgi:hypothetical protein